jgi:hypothetical protein
VNLSLDIASDFAAITDWLRIVTVDGQSVDKTLRRAITTREAQASGGKYLTSDAAFHLDKALHPAEPMVGWQIVDESVAWTILSHELHTLANRWRCVCRKLKISAGEVVSIQRATYTKGATGAKEPAWTTIASGVSARAQYLSAEIDTGHASRSTTTNAKVYFADPQTLQQGDRIVSNAGTILKVIRWEGFDSIEALFSAECEVSKWPQS